MPRHAPTLRHRVFTAALSAIAIAGRSSPTTCSARRVSPDRLDYPLQFEGDIDRGTFHDVFTDYYDVKQSTNSMLDGNLIRDQL